MKRLRIIFSIIVMALTCTTTQAQFGKVLGKAIENAAKSATVRKAQQKTEEAVSKGIDKVTDPNSYKGDGTEENGNNNSNDNNKGGGEENASGGNSNSGKATKPADPAKLESYSQYDFVPGDQILFYEDFSQDAIGDFPALWSTNSSGEVKTLNNYPGKWFQITAKSGVFTYLNSLNLPANFIMEFDYIPYYCEEAQKSNPSRINWYGTASMKLYSYKEGTKTQEVDNSIYPGEMGLRFFIDIYSGWETDGYNRGAENSGGFTPLASRSDRNKAISDQANHIIIWVQGRRVRVYHAGAKVIDAPTLLAANTKLDRLVFANTHEDNRPFFSNIKFTTAAPDVRSKLITEGKLISYGINFDSGKDVIKPESYGAIKSIADVLKENPDVRVRIIGHTDSDGNAASNLDLSKRRAAAVKASLGKDFGIDGSRIETDGKGQTEPLAPNTTSEGKAKNRRVEFVKI